MTTPTPTPEAIEAIAVAMFYQQVGLKPPHPLWDDADDVEKDNCRTDAQLAYDAMAPLIAAQAKGEALAPILALHQPFTVHPSGIGTKYCVHCWGSDGSKEWPCATVNAATYPATIEGKSE